MKKQTILCSAQRLSLAIVSAITIIIGSGISVSAQNEFRGYKVGRYEGDIINTTGNVKGTAAFEVRKIDYATGEVTTYLTPTSSNLTGEGTLTGKIDENGVMRVSGPFSGWTASVVARVSGNTIKANYRLLSGSSSQNGNFTVRLPTAGGNETDDIPVPDAPENEASTNKQTNTTTSNQTNNKFKVGDRVEVNHNGHYNPVWLKGTIVSIYTINDGEQAGFEVRMDDVKDYTGAGQVYRFQAQAVRRLNETAAEKQAQAAKQAAADKAIVKLRLDENNKILADRELLDCDNLGIKPVKNGARPTLETTGKVIRCHHEKKGNAETVTIDITSFQVGAPTKWRLLREVGPDANLSTIVHPIKTTFTQKNYTRAVVYTKVIETIYSCYVNTFGDWRCFNGAFKEKGEMKRTPVQP
ncbi:MAG: hypothetical protein M3384_13330 [Acidobacteriota bacterium]|nr:hypothetical protein [Acidobacteriota bacterium]